MSVGFRGTVIDRLAGAVCQANAGSPRSSIHH
jgi:hypothetical protein